jgi:sugar phosphate isomerase/epimerase
MNTLSRRSFLRSSVTLVTGAVALDWSRDIFSSGPGLQFPTQPRDRLSVASYPFRAFIESPNNRERQRKQAGMDLKEFAAMVVERFNVHNIEPLGDHFRSTDPTYVRGLREAVEKAGARVINIPVSVRASLYDPDATKRKTAVENAKKWVDVARALQSPSIRIHIQGVGGVLPDADRTVETLQPVTEYGAQRGIILNLENDDLVSEDAFFIVKVIEKVNSPYLRALPDFCNSMLSGNEQYNYKAVTAMFKHAYNISHVKDSEVNDEGKVFRVDPGKTFAIAKENGYRGYFSMEWEGQGDPYWGTQKLIDESLKYLA